MKTTAHFCLHLSILLVWLLQISQIRANNYYFEQIALKEGLSTTVNCIYAEKNSFVWIGTPTGLGRFDGHELKKYAHSPENPNSLPHNNILHVAEDSLHNLWVLTEKGVVRYRRRSDDFSLLRDQYGHIVMANTACRTEQGILLGGRNKIYQYNYGDDTIRLLHDFSNIGLFAISYINFWDKETLLCCSRWQGIILLNLRTGEVKSPPFNYGKDIREVLLDSKGRIWLAPYNDGIRCLAHDGTLLASYVTGNSKLNNNVVLCMIEKDSQIWIGTDGGGINILNPETHEISILKHVPGDKYSFTCNSILSLYNDANNNIWAGSTRNGLIGIKEVSMKTYTEVPLSDCKGLSDNTVLCLYRGPSEDEIWIGTDGGGINKLNPSTEKFAHYPNTTGKKVASISGFTSSELLLSVFSKGLYTFSKKTGKINPLKIHDEYINRMLFYSGKTINVYQYEPETVLLLGDRIYQYTIATGNTRVVTEEEGIEIIGTLVPVSHDARATYLFDAQSIYSLDKQYNKLECIYTIKKDTFINCVSRDEHGIFWIGTNHGLRYYDAAKQSIQLIPTPLFTNVRSVINDNHGKVWVAVNEMLFAWLINEKEFMLFGKSDGVLPNEYMAKSKLISASGNIYLGGEKGLLYIDKNLPIERTVAPQIQLTDILIAGESVNEQLKDNPVSISVPWNSKAISIRIMSCEADLFRQKIYRYQISGLNEQCIDSYTPEILIRSLPSGTYRILVSCSMRNGGWTPLQQVLELTVLPPWYKTWWCILCYVLVILGIITWTFIIILRHKENKLKWAMKEHEKEIYEEKVRFLINISHELRTPLTLIHAPLNRILRSLPSDSANYPALKGIYKQSQRMKGLLNMVLDLRKMEVGINTVQFHPLLLNNWIQSIATDFIGEGDARNVHFLCRFDERVKTVCLDKGKCEIILTNLLINALKHSPENSQIIIQTELLPATASVRISVIDQGCGLKQADPQKLFTRFYQGTGERTGTGIGLSYSRILVELHGGKIAAKDNEDGGATFFFELPLKQISSEVSYKPRPYLNELISDMAEEKAVNSVSIKLNKYSLLVVDDNKELIDFIKSAFCKSFNQIFTAPDGEKALEIVRKHQPDIVISDVMMPRMNGYELCRQIKEDISISHIPVILLTARNDDASRLQGYKTGADAYLVKPFEEEILLEVIRGRLRNREQMKARYLNRGLLPPPEEVTFSQIDEAFLLKTNELITEHLGNPDLDISFLCKELCMSRATFYNKLKAITDMGGNDYINKFRLERVIYLITNTNMNFTEISEKAGFSSSRYFSTMFKRYTGKTPSQYKEEHRKSMETEQDNE